MTSGGKGSSVPTKIKTQGATASTWYLLIDDYCTIGTISAD